MLTVRGRPPGHSLALQRGADNSQADRFLPQAVRAGTRREPAASQEGAIACAACDGLGKCDPWTGGSPAVLGFTRGSGLGEKSSRRYGVHSELAPRSSLGGLNCWGLQSRQRAASPTFQLSGGGSESVRVGEPLRSCRLRQSPPDTAGSPGSGSVGLWDQEWLPC